MSSPEIKLQLDTHQMAGAIHDSLWAGDTYEDGDRNYPNRLVTGHDGRALAVCVPELLGEEALAAIEPRLRAVSFGETLQTAQGTRLTYRTTPTIYSTIARSPEFAGALPIGYYSGELFPSQVTEVADLAIRGIAGSTKVRATNLGLVDHGHLKPDAPRHIDVADHRHMFDAGHPLSSPGVNYHIAIGGRALVELGLLDDPAAYEAVQALVRSRLTDDGADSVQAQSDLNDELGQFYRQNCTSWAQFTQHPGDALLWPGEPRLAIGRSALAHRFITASDAPSPRSYVVMKPEIGDTETVLTRRRQALLAGL